MVFFFLFHCASSSHTKNCTSKRWNKENRVFFEMFDLPFRCVRKNAMNLSFRFDNVHIQGVQLNMKRKKHKDRFF